MMSATTMKVAGAVTAGYLLGRTKKLRLAVTVAGLIAGKKLASDPKAIAQKLVTQHPELGHLQGQLTEGLTDAARDVALATAATRIEAMTDAIRGTTETDGTSGGTTRKRTPAKKRASARSGPATKAAAKKSPAKKSSTRKSPAKKTAAKKSTAKKSAAKKSTASSSTSGSRR